MNLRPILLIVQREYMERVHTKSFIITTILMPLLMLGLMALPALMLTLSTPTLHTVMVSDASGVVGGMLTDSDAAHYVLSSQPVDSLLEADDADAVLVIPADVVTGESAISLYTTGSSSLTLEGDIRAQVNHAIEYQRQLAYNIPDLDNMIKAIESDVALQNFRIGSDATGSSSMVSYALGMVLTLLLYMSLLIYGQMVMTGIIEEKNNRVLEIVVSSVKPTHLMMGKILGVCLVAVTQIAIWGVLMAVMSSMALPEFMPESMSADVAALANGNVEASALSNDVAMVQAVSLLGDVGYVMGLFGLLILFLVGGFLLYAAIYAAVGSAVDNIQDASQLQSLVVIPVVAGIAVAMAASSDPTSTIAIVSSYIPFTAPMVMMARIPYGVPAGQIVASLAVLYASFVAMVWVSAKIYRVGIFMYGKKPNIRELWRWINYK